MKQYKIVVRRCEKRPDDEKVNVSDEKDSYIKEFDLFIFERLYGFIPVRGSKETITITRRKK